MKMCDYCGKRPATVHLVEIVHSRKVELHICEKCSEEKKVLISPELQLTDLISKYAEAKGKKGEPTEEASEAKADEKVCSECGMRFSDFNMTQRFGCPNDYDVFRDDIEKLLLKVHGLTQHVGVVPKRISTKAAQESNLLKLGRELEDAIKNEEYEKAAALRDRISAEEAG